jgi:hypothetical protein
LRFLLFHFQLKHLQTIFIRFPSPAGADYFLDAKFLEQSVESLFNGARRRNFLPLFHCVLVVLAGPSLGLMARPAQSLQILHFVRPALPARDDVVYFQILPLPAPIARHAPEVIPKQHPVPRSAHVRSGEPQMGNHPDVVSDAAIFVHEQPVIEKQLRQRFVFGASWH